MTPRSIDEIARRQEARRQLPAARSTTEHVFLLSSARQEAESDLSVLLEMVQRAVTDFLFEWDKNERDFNEMEYVEAIEGLRALLARAQKEKP